MADFHEGASPLLPQGGEALADTEAQYTNENILDDSSYELVLHHTTNLLQELPPDPRLLLQWMHHHNHRTGPQTFASVQYHALHVFQRTVL